MNAQRATAIVSLLLLFGGMAIIGAGVGLRAAIGLTTQVADCSQFACVPVVRQFQQTMLTLLTGGAVAMAAGGVGMWSVRRQAEGQDDG